MRALIVRLSWGAAAAALFSTTASAQTDLSARELERVVQGVVSWREATIPPLARWDWCRVPLVFAGDGALIGGQNVVGPAVGRTRAECAQRDSSAAAGSLETVPLGEVHVRVNAIRLYADSVVVSTSAMRTGGRVAEDYLLRRSGPGKVMSVILLRQWLIVNSH